MRKKTENEEKEVKECTFNPCLTENTKKIIEKKEDYKSFDLYERSVYWKTKNQQSRVINNKSKEKKIIENCAFRPTTYNQLNKEEINQIKSDQDYIYKKNIKWLNQIKENRKHMEIENQVEIAKESVHFKVKSHLLKKPKGNKNVSIQDSIKVKRSFDGFNDINNSFLTKFDQNIGRERYSKDDTNIESEKKNVFNKLKYIEKEFKDIKELFDSVENVYHENKAINKNEEIYSKKTVYSVKNTPQRKQNYQPNNFCNILSRNNRLNKSATTKETNFKGNKNDFSYLDKYQKMLENYIKKDIKQLKDSDLIENPQNYMEYDTSNNPDNGSSFRLN